jgi:hypothetical protein
VALVEMGVEVDERGRRRPPSRSRTGRSPSRVKAPAATTEAMRPSATVRSIRASPSAPAARPEVVVSASGAQALTSR